jgi:hypothetical protein
MANVGNGGILERWNDGKKSETGRRMGRKERKPANPLGDSPRSAFSAAILYVKPL